MFCTWWNNFLWGGCKTIDVVEDSEDQKITEETKMENKSYFTIKELCASQTANNLHIDNTPSETIKKNLTRLIEFLNPLREAWGSPIRISSGYRCQELNKAIGGVATSAHLTGNAVDMVPVNGKQDEFEKFMVSYLQDKTWDQCLKEQSKTARWVHFGLYNNVGQQRKQIKSLQV